MDLRSYHTFIELACIRSCRCHPKMGESDIRIECSSHVRDKKKNARKPVSLWVSRDDTPYQASVGTRVSLLTFHDQNLPDSIPSSSCIKLHKREYKKEICNHLDADVLCAFVIENTKDKGMFFSQGSPTASSSSSYSQIQQCISFLSKFFYPTMCSSNIHSDTTSTSLDRGLEE